MNKTLFSVGALIAGCFALTACSGGGENGASQSVGALSGRTIRLQAPSNALGSMFVRVGDRIGSSTDCSARFSFGSASAASSRGTVSIQSATKGSKGWERCDFTFHIDESEISEEVEFKSFFAIFLSAASSSGNNSDSDDSNNENGDSGSSSGSGNMNSDDYVTGIAPTIIKMTFDSSNSGTYIMEPTTLYLDDSEEPVQTFLITNRFTIED